MRFRSLGATAAAVVLVPAAALGQASPSPVTGPVIDGYGPVYDIAAPDFATPTGPVRAVFDVAEGAGEPGQVNRRIESLARFLNMHARAGVPAERIELALVVHGSAGVELLDDLGYRRRHGVDNANLPLLRALMDQGVQVILCGQTQAARGLARDELADGVQVALSAMTALVALQDRGFSLAAM